MIEYRKIKPIFTFLLIIGLVYHLLALLQIIPMDMVWGGRANSIDELIPLEIFSFITNASLIALIHLRYQKPQLAFPKWIFLLFTILFALNTLGNLLAFNKMEAYIFTPITFISSYFSFRLFRGE